LVNVKVIDFNYFIKEDKETISQHKANEELEKLDLENSSSPIENILKILEDISNQNISK
jgi:hypothetical protein